MKKFRWKLITIHAWQDFKRLHLGAGFKESVEITTAQSFYIMFLFWAIDIAILKLPYFHCESKVYWLLQFGFYQCPDDPEIALVCDWTEQPVIFDITIFYWVFSISVFKNKSEIY